MQAQEETVVGQRERRGPQSKEQGGYGKGYEIFSKDKRSHWRFLSRGKAIFKGF